MPRVKKSRKPGSIGVKKDVGFRKDGEKSSKHTTKKKPAKGNPSGSRHSAANQTKRSSQSSKNTDPRHGSKKPIALVTTKQKQSYATPAQELAAIEADARLTALLNKVEAGETLRAEQQHYVNEKLARHAVLCDLMGISNDDDDEADDPYADLDAISMSDFDDSEKD